MMHNVRCCDLVMQRKEKNVLFIFSVLTPASEFYLLCFKIKMFKAPHLPVGNLACKLISLHREIVSCKVGLGGGEF